MSKSIILVMCDSPDKNKIFRNTINEHHSYMDYKDTANRRINWNVYESKSGNLIGAVGVNSAIMAMSARDQFIGWDKENRLKKLINMANNYRFCIIKDNVTIKNEGILEYNFHIFTVTF